MKRLGRAFLISAVLGLGSMASLDVPAYPLTLDSASAAVYVGDVFNVDLKISGLGDAVPPSVGAFDTGIQYNPALVTFTGYALGAGLGVSADFSSGDDGAGSVSLYEVSLELPVDLNALQTDEVLLATLTFRAAAAGTSTFTIGFTIISDENGAELTIHEFGEAVVTIAEREGSAPIPPTGVLLLPGLLYLYGRRFASLRSERE